MSDKKELTFRKRVQLVKKEVFEKLSETGELDSIAGTNKQGYYSLKSIIKFLNPAMDKYDVDLDLNITDTAIVGQWFDCLSDNTRDITVDFTDLKGIDRLPSMANLVQSNGAIKSYTRRYAYTNILGLNATDEIDNPNPNPNNKKQDNKSNTKVSEAQLKRLYAIAKNKEIEDTDMLDKKIEQAFKIKSKKELSKTDYKNFTDFMEEHTSIEIFEMLDKKINKEKK